MRILEYDWLGACVSLKGRQGAHYVCGSHNKGWVQLWRLLFQTAMGDKNVSAHCIPSPAHLLQYIYNCHNGYESTMLLCYHISIPIWPLCLNSDHQYILYGWPYFGLVIKPFNTIR